MKAKDIIDNYCQFYGVDIPKSNLPQEDYFVAIDSKDATIYPYKRSKLLGQILGSVMKRGVVLYVKNGWVEPLMWENWRDFWGKHFAPQGKKDNLPERYRVPRHKTLAFEEGKPNRGDKKSSRRGTETTYTVNTSLYRLG